MTSEQLGEGMSSWMPTVETGDESYRWRRAWVYDLGTHGARQIFEENTNIREAVWCGNEAIAAVFSLGPLVRRSLAAD